MPGDIDSLTDEEQAGNVVRFHRARVQIVGIHATRRNLSFLESLGARGTKLPTMQALFAGFQCGIGPAVGRAAIDEPIGETLWECRAQNLPECSGIAWSA